MNERELKGWMTREQLREWNTARKTGGSTFLHLGAPDSGSDGMWLPSCDDGHWSATWHGVCFDVVEGEAYAIDWSCDTDGNWDYDTRCPLGEYKGDADDYREACRAQREYATHVAQTGDDPLGEYFVPSHVNVEETYEFQFVETDTGMALARARKPGKEWQAANTLPRHVLQYAGVDNFAQSSSYRRVRWDAGDVKLDERGRITETWTYRKARPITTIKSELRAAARRHLNREEAA